MGSANNLTSAVYVDTFRGKPPGSSQELVIYSNQMENL